MDGRRKQRIVWFAMSIFSTKTLVGQIQNSCHMSLGSHKRTGDPGAMEGHQHSPAGDGQVRKENARDRQGWALDNGKSQPTRNF
ncbi:hypothetical protein AUP68_08914 [Ilyonectria robusta]